MLIKKLFSGSYYYMLNKTLLKEVGLDEALILSCLIDANEIFEEEWFYQTSDTIQELTTLSEFRQTKAINKLIKLNILEKKVKGLPAKRYFRINSDKVLEILEGKFSNNLKTSSEETSKNKESIYKECSRKEISDKENNDKELKSKDKELKNKDSNNIYIDTVKGRFTKQYLIDVFEGKGENEYKLSKSFALEIINKNGGM